MSYEGYYWDALESELDTDYYDAMVEEENYYANNYRQARRGKSMILRNVRCKWASIVEPNTKFEPVYEIVAMLDDKQAAELADKGFKLKTEDDGSLSYRFKIRVEGTKKDGTKFEKPKPTCIDAAKQPFTELVGNGSLVNIQYELKKGNFAGVPFCRGELQGVQVLEHVSFGADEFDDEGETKSIEGEDSESVGDDSPF
ncbi:MAG: hypothetical protein OCD76_07250 [Reichenbachiella sp.]